MNNFSSTLLVAFIALSFYNLGSMLTLQLQHFAIYPTVGEETFRAFISANNRAALAPAILPFLLTTLVGALMFWKRNPYLNPVTLGWILVLNLLFILITVVWSGRIQGQMAVTGYDPTQVVFFIRTNWLRTAIFFVEACIALNVLLRVVK